MNEEFEEMMEFEHAIPPYILMGIWKPNRIVKVRAGIQKPIKTKTDKYGRWIIDLANLDNGYNRYKYVYVNNIRCRLNKSGSLKVDIK